MIHRDSGPIVVGVDVDGPKNGFHAVAVLDGQFVEMHSSIIGAEIAEWCRTLKASVFGIDAPCRWSLTGGAASCERAFAAQGLHPFATSSQTVGKQHPFHRWMLNGADLYRCLRPDYFLFNGQWQAITT